MQLSHTRSLMIWGVGGGFVEIGLFGGNRLSLTSFNGFGVLGVSASECVSET